MMLYIMYPPNNIEGPLPTIIAYVLCWPVVLIGNMTYWPWGPGNLDRVFWPFGWLALSLYYYVIISLIAALWRLRSERADG